MTAPGWTAEDRRAVNHAWTGAAIVTVLATLGSVAPFLGFVLQPGADRWVALYLMPQGVPGALMLATTLGTLFALDGRQLSLRVGAGLFGLALAASIVSLVDLAWLTPAGNQAFRVAAAGKPELLQTETALGELWQFASEDVRFDFHLRWAFAAAPLVMAVAALSIVRFKRASRWTAGVAAVVMIVGHYSLLYVARNLALSGSLVPVVAAWLPNVVIAAVAVGLLLMNRRGAFAVAG